MPDIHQKDCKGKMKGDIGWSIITLALDRDPWKLYLMFLSREINWKLCQIYTKVYVFKILHKNSRFKQIIFRKKAILWECSKLVTWYRQRHVITIMHYHWWEFWWRKKYKIIIGANQFLWDVFVIRSVVYLLNMICLNLLFLYKIVYIWIFVQIWHSFLSICRDRNIRYNFYGSQSRAKVIRLQPIPPFVFPFYFLFSIFYFLLLFSIFYSPFKYICLR